MTYNGESYLNYTDDVISNDERAASENNILKGKTAIVRNKDELEEGIMKVQSIVNFNIVLYNSLPPTRL